MDEDRRLLDRAPEDWITKHRKLMADARAGDTTAAWEMERFEKFARWLKAALDKANTECGGDPVTADEVAAFFLKEYESLAARPIAFETSINSFKRGRPGIATAQIVLVAVHRDTTAIGVGVTSNGFLHGAWAAFDERLPARTFRDRIDLWRMLAATENRHPDRDRVYGDLTEFLVHWAKVVHGEN